MKLLFDQNLSPQLVVNLADLFPKSTHVWKESLDRAQDNEIWEYANKNDYLIVSKDSDFSEISFIRGFPPKVIWIRRGNCSTKDIEELFRREYNQIEKLYQSKAIGILLLY